MLASFLEKSFRSLGLNNFIVSFILGIIFSLLGVFLALYTGFGFVALFVISIAVIPVISKYISLSELVAGRVSSVTRQGVVFESIQPRSTHWNIKQFFDDFLPVFKVYLVYFLTVFAVFVQVGTFLEFEVVSSVFEGQFGFFSPNEHIFFETLLVNNVGVLLLGFLFSFLFEFGATFVVVRNSIFWGLTLGLFLSVFPSSPLGLVLIFPHLVLEASAYFVSSISGSVLSKVFSKEKTDKGRFYSLLTQVFALLALSIILVVLGAVIETIVFNDILPNILY